MGVGPPTLTHLIAAETRTKAVPAGAWNRPLGGEQVREGRRSH